MFSESACALKIEYAYLSLRKLKYDKGHIHFTKSEFNLLIEEAQAGVYKMFSRRKHIFKRVFLSCSPRSLKSTTENIYISKHKS